MKSIALTLAVLIGAFSFAANAADQATTEPTVEEVTALEEIQIQPSQGGETGTSEAK